ncbi:hypothetical protein HDU93_006733 [Gonapodya sp. JEL0774]|nr:hypothetical protein HDU93_006733 [Gonapodya sp. JEL0774]
MALSTGAVHCARVGTVFVLLAKLESEQRQLQDALHKEKRQLESIVGVTATAAITYLVAFFINALSSGCASAFWLSQSILHLAYFIFLLFVVARFNSSATLAGRIIQRAERELSFIVMDLVLAKNALSGFPSGSRNAETQPWNGWARQDSVIHSDGSAATAVNTASANPPELHPPELPTTELLTAARVQTGLDQEPQHYPFVETLKSVDYAYNRTLPAFSRRDQYTGRAYPILCSMSLAVPRDLLEARLLEARAHQGVLTPLTQSFTDEHLVTFLGMPVAFESARAITLGAIVAIFAGYQLFRSGGYTLGFAYACGA